MDLECRIPGHMYSGTENKTIKGADCQYWSDQKPHRHDYDQIGLNQSNNCRNFDRDRAWCLTNQIDVLWDYCDVPVCENLCYDWKSSRSFDSCPVKTSGCSEIDDLVSCHISHVEKTYKIPCFDSWVMRRAIVSNLVEHNIITDQLRLKCFPSPCASEEFLESAKLGTYTGLLPYSQKTFCWSVMRLINKGIATITVTNRSTCYTSDKRMFLSAIQTRLGGMFDKTKFQVTECPLTITYDKTEVDKEMVRSTKEKIEMFILTHLHYVIGGFAGVLLIAVLFLVGRLKVKKASRNRTDIPNRSSDPSRQSHIYHDIVDIDENLKMPYEMEEKKEKENHSYITLQPKTRDPNEGPSRLDISNNGSSVLYSNTGHSEQHNKPSKSEDRLPVGISRSEDRSPEGRSLENSTDGFVKIHTKHEKFRQELNTQLLKTFQFRKSTEPIT